MCRPMRELGPLVSMAGGRSGSTFTNRVYRAGTSLVCGEQEPRICDLCSECSGSQGRVLADTQHPWVGLLPEMTSPSDDFHSSCSATRMSSSGNIAMATVTVQGHPWQSTGACLHHMTAGMKIGDL